MMRRATHFYQRLEKEQKLISTLRLMQELINPLSSFLFPIFFCFFLSYYPLNIKRFHEEKKRKINRKEIENVPYFGAKIVITFSCYPTVKRRLGNSSNWINGKQWEIVTIWRFFQGFGYLNFRDKITVSYFWRENSNNVLFSNFFPPP